MVEYGKVWWQNFWYIYFVFVMQLNTTEAMRNRAPVSCNIFSQHFLWLRKTATRYRSRAAGTHIVSVYTYKLQYTAFSGIEPVLSAVSGEAAPSPAPAWHAAPSPPHPACVPEPRDTGPGSASQNTACKTQGSQVKQGGKHKKKCFYKVPASQHYVHIPSDLKKQLLEIAQRRAVQILE